MSRMPKLATRIPARSKKTRAAPPRQINVRVEPAFYRALETIARQDRRSVPQAARHLMEESLRRRTAGRSVLDDTPGTDIARLAMGGGAFDWLADEPDLYGADAGEPV